GAKRCPYLLVNTNTDEIWGDRIEYDPAFAMQTLARAERIIRANRRPARIQEDRAQYPCMLCPAADVCHGEKFGRVNCRTCISSTPIVDESDGAKWHCERHNKILTRE